MTNSAPIWIYYENIATHDTILPPKRIDGVPDEKYTISVPDIPDYTYSENSDDLSGAFSEFPQSHHLYYQPISWRTVHRVNMYIMLLTEVAAQSEPDDDANISTILPAKSYWETPLRVISGNGQFWYQVGTHDWLRYDASLMTLSDDAPSGENVNYIEDIENSQPNALVNFLPGLSTEVFESPYGLPVGSVLDGNFVSIIKEQHDDNGLIWYKLAASGWINSIYIDKL